MVFALFYAFLTTFILQVFGLPIAISTENASQINRERLVVLTWGPQDTHCFHPVSFASCVTSGRGRERHSAESLAAAHKPFISFGVAGLHHTDPLGGESVILHATSQNARVLNEDTITNVVESVTFEASRKINDRDLHDDGSEDVTIRADSGGAIILKNVKDAGNATSGDVTINGGGRGSTAISGDSTTNGGQGGAATSGNVRINGGGRGSTAISGDTTSGQGATATGGDPPITGENGGNATSGTATTGDGGNATSGNAQVLSGTATSGSATTSGGVGGNATSGNAIVGEGGNANSGDATNSGDGGSATSGDAIVDGKNIVDGEPTSSATPTSAVQIASSTASPSTGTSTRPSNAPVIIRSTIGSLALVAVLGILAILWSRRKSRFRDDNTSKAESLRTDFRPFSVGTLISSPPSVLPYPFAPNSRCSNFPLPSGSGLPQTITTSPSRGSYLRSREEEHILVQGNPTRSTVEPVEPANGQSPPPSYQLPR
ncbi:hypothetical protein DFS33DRAFT_980151 [Desarmillaria ectypa]|nr:hypothetical protein DFS33DRAFT_980151 [Desarmillaria ectypa]